jgi:Ribonuclease 2-5A
MHPYFWDAGQRLGFLQDASDRFEIMCRDPRDPHLILLENDAINVVGPDWPARLDKIFVENLGKFRKYDGRSVQDLLRALRNKVCVLRPSLTKPPIIFYSVSDASFVLFPFTTETPLSGPT